MTIQQPLDYEPPSRRPPKRPVAAIFCALGGAALVFLHPRSSEAVEFASFIVAGGLLIVGSVLSLKFLGEKMDYDAKQQRKR